MSRGSDPHEQVALTPRQQRIVATLKEDGFVSTSALAVDFGVSDMTIRRDARRLEKSGAAVVVHGGLMLPHGTVHTGGFVHRAQVDADAKRRIGAACAEVIGERDRVLIDAGTTAFEVARALPREFEGTIITHSAPVIQLALGMPLAKTVGLGGELLLDSQAFIGEITMTALSGLRANTAFIGASAIDDKGLYIERNLELATKRAIMQSADRVVLTITRSKMDASDLVFLCPFTELHALVTDEEPPEAIARALADSGIDVVVAA